ncbi:MAG: carboxymuconolactone decarboxylase family protein, partial [Salinisphaeraceae bacterium]|nr:carboxymuconolactone decarboxylase family protein [Salinisphaeraceae bacterium]
MNTAIEQQLTPQGGWQQPEQPRLTPLTLEESSLGIRIIRSLIARVGKLEASNLFLMLMRNFDLFWRWLLFAKRMMPSGRLPRRDTELAILRVGWNCRCRYEWGQHVDIGLRCGVSPEDIARVAHGPQADGWEPKLRAVMQACDEIHTNKMISTATWEALTEHYNEKLLLELVMLI